MSIDKPSERGEQRDPNDWERIHTEWDKRAKAQREYDATHDPSPEFEAAARPLGPDYGKDRPASRTVTADQVAEMVEMWGQRNVDKMVASGKLVLERTDHNGHGTENDPAPGHDRDRFSDDAESRADSESHDPPDGDRPGDSNGWDHVGGEKPDRASIHVNEARQTYILDGNGRGGGGHFPGTGLPNKTEYPASWDDQKVISEVEDVARNPDYPPELQENGRWKIQGTRDGVTMTVIINPTSEIHSAFPRHGPGVIHNDEHGNPKPAPTER